MRDLEVAALAIVGALAYAGSLWMWPFRPCRRCGGSGTNMGSNRRRHGNCSRCKGTRRVVRLGARPVWLALRKRQP